MGRSKGMTLVELLIAMGLSVIIMAATFVVVQYSSDTYESTIEMVDENNNTHDASNIINKYIRSAYFCSLTDSGKSLLVTVDSETFTGTSGQKQTIKIAFDEDDKRLYLDRMNGEEPILIAEEIHRIEWMIAMNGVKYSAYTVKASGDESLYFFGYARKRGR